MRQLYVGWQKRKLDLYSLSFYNESNMNHQDRSTRLRKLGLIPTIQRVAVLEFLENNLVHPTADEIYNGVKGSFPSLSKATVYNVLDVLKQTGAIRELGIARQAARYDIRTSAHPHFMCRVCDRVYDIDLPHAVQEGDIVDGHQVESVQTYIYGICAHCRAQAAKSNPGLEAQEEAARMSGRKDA